MRTCAVLPAPGPAVVFKTAATFPVWDPDS